MTAFLGKLGERLTDDVFPKTKNVFLWKTILRFQVIETIISLAQVFQIFVMMWSHHPHRVAILVYGLCAT